MAKGIIEYAGYRAPQTTNWDKVLGDVGEDITGAVVTREKQRASDLNIQQETEAAINDFTTGVSQDYTDYVSRGVESNRNLMMEYTKQLRSNKINSTQYKRLMNRVNSDWQQFGQFSKDFEKRLADMQTRNKDGVSSVIEGWNGERIASAADFKNKQLVPNASSGGLYSVSFDKEGKPIKKDIIHMNELNNFGTQLVDRVNLQDQIKTITDKAGDFKSVIATGNIKTAEGISDYLANEDPRFKEGYDNLIKSIEESVLSGPPNKIASSLADNSLNSKQQPFFIYQDGDLAKGGKFEGKDAEDGVKMVQQSDGSWGGELTDGQRELLRKKSKEIADAQLGFKEVYMNKDLREEELKEQKRQNLESERLKRKREERLAAGDGDDPKEPDYKPYTQLLESFDAKNASRVIANPKVLDASYSKNGTELIVQLKGTDKTPGGTETYSTTDKEGQKAIARLMNPDLDQAEIDALFDKDYNSYVDETGKILKQEDRKKVARDEVIVIEETDFTQRITVGDKPVTYSFDNFIDQDWLDNAPKKVQYVKDLALNSGILDLKDTDNLDIEVVDKDRGNVFDDDFMKITYTMPDGRVIESDTLDNDPGIGQGNSKKENKDIFENFLQELRKELYFKGEAPEAKKETTRTNVEIDENL